MPQFNIGDKVSWKSQAAGNYKLKTGTVVAVLFKGNIPYRYAMEHFPKHKRMFDGGDLPGNYNTAYLVEVKDGKTDKAAPKLYMPYPKQLISA